MPVAKSLGTPQLTGNDLDGLKQSTQFWLQQVYNHLDAMTGLRGTPKFYGALDAGGNALKNVALATEPSDAVVKSQTLTLSSDATQYDANGVGIVNLPAGSNDTDAVNLGQLATAVADILRNTPGLLPFADPTASVILTVVPGTASTIMRSDAAPPLSQSIVPTWSGLHTFAVNPIVTNTAPGLTFTDTTAAAKSLTIATDANFAQLRESAGASGSLLTLDLTNNRVGIGTAAPTTALQVSSTANVALTSQVVTTDAAGTVARAIVQALASTATIFMTAHGAGRVATRYGITLGSYAEILVSAGNGLLVGTTNATPFVVGTNDIEALRISSTQNITVPTGKTLTVGSNVLYGSVTDKLNAANLAIASQAVGDLLTGATTTTFTRLAAVALGSALMSAGTSTAPVWIAPKNVAVLTDAATVTLAVGADGRPYLGTLAALSQATLFANPTGTPFEGQLFTIRIISTVARALTWDTKFKGSTAMPLPTTTTGSSLRDFFGFQYTSSTDTYDFLASATGIG